MTPQQKRAYQELKPLWEDLIPGDRLPSERELSFRSGASRSVIRGMLQALEQLEIIQQRGSGRWLKKHPDARVRKNLQGPTMNRRQVVRAYLLESLALGKLRPGDQITEVSIAKATGAAVVSVREALLELLALGVFYKDERRRWRVLSFTRKSVVDLCEFREMVETFCLRLIGDRGLSESQRNRLDELRRRTCAMARDRKAGAAEILVVDLDFHRFLLEAAENPFLTDKCSFLYLIIEFQLLNPLFSRERGQLGLRQHLEIQKALLAVDFPGAETALKRHLQAAELTFQTIIAGRKI